ncbi:MAG: biotin transporter BioY [Clostridiales bacterium]|nr:biotin transporter BioY [Clostridiales bacterium]
MKIKDMTIISLFIALMITGAFIKFPFPFIELTFQAFFAIMAGLILGYKKGISVTLLYLLLGLFGLPVFSKGGGISYVLIPSFGFIISFIPGSFMAGFLYQKRKWNKYIAALVGMLFIYLIGIPYFYGILRLYLNSNVAFLTLLISFIPYLIKDLLLAILGGYLLRYFRFLNLEQ